MYTILSRPAELLVSVVWNIFKMVMSLINVCSVCIAHIIIIILGILTSDISDHFLVFEIFDNLNLKCSQWYCTRRHYSEEKNISSFPNH